MTDADKDRKLAFYDETSDLLRRGPAGYRLEVVYGDDDKLQLRQTEALPVVASPRQAAVRHLSPATSYPLYRPIMTELVADPTRTSTSCCTSTAKKASTSSALVQP
jgi:hypothetical protein